MVILTIAGSVGDVVNVASIALVRLAAYSLGFVHTFIAVLWAYCQEQVNHVLTLIFLLDVRKYATDHNNNNKIIGSRLSFGILYTG